MTVAAELDAWAADLANATGLLVTRDPDLIHPPCVFVAGPEAVTSPAGGTVLDLPVYVVASGAGKQQMDELVDMLPTVLDATGQQLAAIQPITVGEIPYNAFLIQVQVRLN